MKTMVTKPHQSAIRKARQDERPDAAGARLQQLKSKSPCYHFNSPEGCLRGQHYPYDHSTKVPKAILDQMRTRMETQRKKVEVKVATARLASATAALASIAAKKETISSSSSSIKSTEFYCSLSSSIPKLLTNESYLDTEASHSMSPNENMFTDLMMSRVAIHCANYNVIHSTKVGVFHLKTVSHDGT